MNVKKRLSIVRVTVGNPGFTFDLPLWARSSDWSGNGTTYTLEFNQDEGSSITEKINKAIDMGICKKEFDYQQHNVYYKRTSYSKHKFTFKDSDDFESKLPELFKLLPFVYDDIVVEFILNGLTAQNVVDNWRMLHI
jgi:hypothetical protein